MEDALSRKNNVDSYANCTTNDDLAVDEVDSYPPKLTSSIEENKMGNAESSTPSKWNKVHSDCPELSPVSKYQYSSQSLKCHLPENGSNSCLDKSADCEKSPVEEGGVVKDDNCVEKGEESVINEDDTPATGINKKQDNLDCVTKQLKSNMKANRNSQLNEKPKMSDVNIVESCTEIDNLKIGSGEKQPLLTDEKSECMAQQNNKVNETISYQNFLMTFEKDQNTSTTSDQVENGVLRGAKVKGGKKVKVKRPVGRPKKRGGKKLTLPPKKSKNPRKRVKHSVTETVPSDDSYIDVKIETVGATVAAESECSQSVPEDEDNDSLRQFQSCIAESEPLQDKVGIKIKLGSTNSFINDKHALPKKNKGRGHSKRCGMSVTEIRPGRVKRNTSSSRQSQSQLPQPCVTKMQENPIACSGKVDNAHININLKDKGGKSADSVPPVKLAKARKGFHSRHSIDKQVTVTSLEESSESWLINTDISLNASEVERRLGKARKSFLFQPARRCIGIASNENRTKTDSITAAQSVPVKRVERARKSFACKSNRPANIVASSEIKSTEVPTEKKEVPTEKKARKSMNKRRSKDAMQSCDDRQMSILSFFKGNMAADGGSAHGEPNQDINVAETADYNSLHTACSEKPSICSASPMRNKPPRARKSFNNKSSSNLSSLEAPGSPMAPSSPFTPMTIKVTELESVLGIQQKSLESMDAKTLDKLMLKKMQLCKTESMSEDLTDLTETDITADVMDTGVSAVANGNNVAVMPTPSRNTIKRRRKRRKKMGTYKLPNVKNNKKVSSMARHRERSKSQESTASTTSLTFNMRSMRSAAVTAMLRLEASNDGNEMSEIKEDAILVDGFEAVPVHHLDFDTATSYKPQGLWNGRQPLRPHNDQPPILTKLFSELSPTKSNVQYIDRYRRRRGGGHGIGRGRSKSADDSMPHLEAMFSGDHTDSIPYDPLLAKVRGCNAIDFYIGLTFVIKKL